MISPETIAELRKRYAEPDKPMCHLCGADMALGEVGGGRAVWFCDGDAGKWMGMEPGSEKRDRERHFDASRIVRTQFGDDRVLALLDEHEKLHQAAVHFLGCALTAQRKNTTEWMEWITEKINDFAEVLGHKDRCEFRPRRGDLGIIRVEQKGDSPTEYRRLEHGEIIQAGDEIDRCSDAWRDDAKWEPVHPNDIGQPAPDPQYPSHRQYRRQVAGEAKGDAA